MCFFPFLGSWLSSGAWKRGGGRCNLHNSATMSAMKMTLEVQILCGNMFPLKSVTRSDDVKLHGNYVMITKWQSSWVSRFSRDFRKCQNWTKNNQTTKRTVIFVNLPAQLVEHSVYQYCRLRSYGFQVWHLFRLSFCSHLGCMYNSVLKT